MMPITFLTQTFLFSLVSSQQKDQIPLRSNSIELFNSSNQYPDHIGVGLDFSSNYVTAAVSFPNGTTSVITTLEGNWEYIHLMRQVSLSSSQHLAPPYNDLGEVIADQPRQMWRKFRRSIGLPSCDEARIFASMIRPLKDIIESRLNRTITHAQASFPSLIALYDEDVWDAFDYVGLIFQEFILWEKTMPDLSANYASQGLYLCKHYKDPDICRVEQRELDKAETGSFSTFNFHLSEEALYLSIPVIRSPYSFNLFGDCHFEGSHLGLRAKWGSDQDAYWDKVEGVLETVVQNCKSVWQYEALHKVFITGSGAQEATFVDIVKKISSKRGTDVEYIMDEPCTLTATGTAELAKRDRYMFPDRPQPSVQA